MRFIGITLFALLLVGCASTATIVDNSTGLVSVSVSGPRFIYDQTELAKRAKEAATELKRRRNCVVGVPMTRTKSVKTTTKKEGKTVTVTRTVPDTNTGSKEKLLSDTAYTELKKLLDLANLAPKNSYTWKAVCIPKKSTTSSQSPMIFP